jgi:glycosyltransferase involved in cell wall biosynthesis
MRQRNNFAVPRLLSVVIPAYKQERTIYRNVLSIEKALQAITPRYELIVVVDGLNDKTFERVQKIKSKRLKVLGYKKNQGKGHAVRLGMMKAKGDVIGFIDAGMDINPTGFSMLLSHMAWYNADIIVGSKLHPVSKVRYPSTRKILSWGYRFLTRILFGFKIRDTQVGIKFFKRKVVRKVLPRLLVKRFAFDIEILAVSYNLGYVRIYEAPVEIKLKSESTITKGNFTTVFSVDFWKIIFFMMWDTIAVFYRIKIKDHYSKNGKVRKIKSTQKLSVIKYARVKI